MKRIPNRKADREREGEGREREEWTWIGKIGMMRRKAGIQEMRGMKYMECEGW